jgi:hypothetical protein
MYMRVTRSRVDPARSRPGRDRPTGRAIAVSTWDTEEHARWIPDDLGDIGSRLQMVGIQVAHPSSSR